MEQYYRIVALVLGSVLGLAVGSFLNVVIYRVPNGMSLAKPASHCTSCGYSLHWYDNIPVLSYLLLRGKCRSCGAHISLRYTLVELANMLLWLGSVLIFWHRSPVYAAVAALASSVLLCIFFIDLEHMLIFNRFTLTLALLGVAAVFFDPFTRPLDHLFGALGGAAVFCLLYFGAILVLKREGLGWGDVKLSAAAGLLLGWQKLILAMLIASVVGSIVLLILQKCRRDEADREYPFAPFLTLGFAVAMLAGAPIITWYLSLFHIA